jgi:uncharacterized protein (DUF488 family)
MSLPVGRPLFTIGYEAKTQAELIAELKAAGVRRVIDVRAVAASRRPGFSKTILSQSLKAHGIDYLHLRALGTPKAGRDAARKGQIALMREIYADQLATPEAELAMKQVEAAGAETPSALLCFEREAAGCHRAMIVERLADRGFNAVDL